MCHIAREGDPVSVVAFPGPADRASLAAAVDRYLDSVQTATTRASYAETLARLVDVAGAGRRADAGGLRRGDGSLG
jgi:hypothetical protein